MKGRYLQKKEAEKTQRFAESFSVMRKERENYDRNIGKEWEKKKEEAHSIEQERLSKTKEFLNYNLERVKKKQEEKERQRQARIEEEKKRENRRKFREDYEWLENTLEKNRNSKTEKI